ncbi:trypsin-like serine protease [Corynebacterium macginleyi]|uniref:trypsin-like serine protease n=1 Tax=Corynebacterium macginleyi TaxID=38290 RepID=UPI00190C3ED3|nr:trypsin-like serine protease [Corynebacterium macginleyi]
MLGISHLKKVLVGSAFAGVFFLASPAVGAQELPQADIDSAEFFHHVRDGRVASDIQAPELDRQVAGSVDSTLRNARDTVAQNAWQGNQYAEPATNPNPLGLLEQTTQLKQKPLGTNPNYRWKSDTFSTVAAGKPDADFVLHRVPGSWFDAPRIPEESDVSMSQGKSLYGPGTPIYVNGNTMCTLSVAGYDDAGRKVGLTAGHCGNEGDAITSADSYHIGPTGTIVSKNSNLDYAVIEFGSNAEVTRTYNGVTVNSLGGAVRPGETVCKQGVATGKTCGMTYQQAQNIQVNQVCAMMGDSGAPLLANDRLIGSISGGFLPVNFPCRTPLQGPVHNPTAATNMDAVLADVNRRGGVGVGFTLPEA